VSAKPTNVAICIATRLRPVGLTRLLESINGLEFHKNGDVRLRVVVVDNDPAGTARSTVAEAEKSSRWSFRYGVERERGISFARNRSVALADGSDYFAFVDDDEVVDPAWLDELLSAQRRFEADAVAGRVVAEYESEPPLWITQQHVFSSRRRPTGTPIDTFATTNLLLRGGALASIKGPFDPRFALSGGSDRALAARLARSGARLIWCEEAVTTECVSRDRMSLKWMLRRYYRIGNTKPWIERALEPELRVNSVAVLLEGVGLLLRSLLLLPSSFFKGRGLVVNRLRFLAMGVGEILGLLGHKYLEYRDMHGR
jgi:glycosyltransferase involved in cell wall biosynthesis